MSCAQACSIFFFSAKGLYYFLTMLKVNVVTGKLGKFTSPTKGGETMRVKVRSV